jgi:hypothetical protein
MKSPERAIVYVHMFSDDPGLLTRPRPVPPPTVAAIECQIVLRLAQSAGREPLELECELHMAGRDLPVDASEMCAILSVLERDFGVALPENNALAPRLNYVHELALFIQAQMLEASIRASVQVVDPESSGATGEHSGRVSDR